MKTAILSRVSQEHLARYTLLLITLFITATSLSSLFTPRDVDLALPGAALSGLMAILCLSFWRGWTLAGPLTVLLMSAMTGIMLPEPFVSQYAPAVVILPMIVALLVAPTLWSLVAGISTITMLVFRAGFHGVYTEPTTIIILATMNATIVMSRMLVERSLGEARSLNRTLEIRVTERTAALAAQHERAQRLLNTKVELYSTVAHDLNNDVLAADDLAHALALAWRAGDTALALAHEERLLGVLARQRAYAADLFDVSVLSEGQQKLPLRMERVNLPQIACRLADELVLMSQPFGIMIEVETAPDLEDVWCDPRRIERVLRNMMGNAIKAMKLIAQEGPITVRFQMEGGFVRCDVIDSGAGIDPEDLLRLGHRFVRANLPGAQGDGTGLGLTLSAQLVSLMGGKLSLYSPGRELGATATFTIPAAVQKERAA